MNGSWFSSRLKVDAKIKKFNDLWVKDKAEVKHLRLLLESLPGVNQCWVLTEAFTSLSSTSSHFILFFKRVCDELHHTVASYTLQLQHVVTAMAYAECKVMDLNSTLAHTKHTPHTPGRGTGCMAGVWAFRAEAPSWKTDRTQRWLHVVEKKKKKKKLCFLVVSGWTFSLVRWVARAVGGRGLRSVIQNQRQFCYTWVGMMT